MKNLKQAYEEAVENKIISGRIDFGKKIFGKEFPEANLRVRVGNLLNGNTTKVDQEGVEKICSALKIDANKLFNIKTK